MSEHEEMLMCKTSIIIGKDTSQMKLNDIIEELVKVNEVINRVGELEKENNIIEITNLLTLKYTVKN